MPAVNAGTPLQGAAPDPTMATPLGRSAAAVQPLPQKTDPGADPNSLDPNQIANIKTIIGVGKALGMGEQAIVTAIAVADDESTFLNYASTNQPQSLNYPHQAVGSDHQSVGVFQQQVGYGWGNFPEIMDVAHQAMAFFGASPKANAPGMLQQKGWQSMDPGALAQQIQQSGTPEAYYPLVEFARRAYSAFSGAPAVKLPVAPKAHGPFPMEDPNAAGMRAAAVSAVKGGTQQQVNTSMTQARTAQSKLNLGNPSAPPPPPPKPAPPAPVLGRNIVGTAGGAGGGATARAI